MTPNCKSTSVYRPCSKRTELYTRNIADEFVKIDVKKKLIEFFFVRHPKRSYLISIKWGKSENVCVCVYAFACIWVFEWMLWQHLHAFYAKCLRFHGGANVCLYVIPYSAIASNIHKTQFYESATIPKIRKCLTLLKYINAKEKRSQNFDFARKIFGQFLHFRHGVPKLRNPVAAPPPVCMSALAFYLTYTHSLSPSVCVCVCVRWIQLE